MTLKCIHTKNYPIFEQLKLEEALLRADNGNWCIINEGTPDKSIVMGLSGKADELIDLPKAARDSIPIIRRFSGGGTVIVDKETLFVTFIFNKESHPFPAYPMELMQWSHAIYQEAFKSHTPLLLRENDYAIGEKKCGGNAQYISRTRWLHHTSFLWDFNPQSMHYLLHPKRTPKYRAERSHLDFLCKLSTIFPSKELLLTSLKTHLNLLYGLTEIPLEQASQILSLPHTSTTTQM